MCGPHPGGQTISNNVKLMTMAKDENGVLEDIQKNVIYNEAKKKHWDAELLKGLGHMRTHF